MFVWAENMKELLSISYFDTFHKSCLSTFQGSFKETITNLFITKLTFLDNGFSNKIFT